MYTYRPDVLEMLAVHGIFPTPQTPPEFVRDFLRDLYKYELRRLRDRYVAGEFAKPEYWGRVDELRRRYPALHWPARLWTE
jgi:hypothetical protein